VISGCCSWMEQGGWGCLIAVWFSIWSRGGDSVRGWNRVDSGLLSVLSSTCLCYFCL
jgi:hypothetical protein